VIDKRIHNSTRPVTSLDEHRPQRPFARKPSGLWWANGNSWTDLVASNPRRSAAVGRKAVGDHSYEVHLGEELRLLRLESFDDLVDFSIRFAQPMPHAAEGFFWQSGNKWRYDPSQDPEMPKRMRAFLINWPEVAKLYDGIEIASYEANRAGRPEIDWLDIDWDVSSGCAWNTRHLELTVIPTLEQEHAQRGRKSETNAPEIIIEELPGGDMHARFYRPSELPENDDMYDDERLRYMNYMSVHKEHHIYARDGMKIVGDLALQKIPHEEDAFWIQHVTVDPEYRNQGVAKRMLWKAAEYALEAGCRLESSSFSRAGADYLLRTIDAINDEHPDLIDMPNGRAPRFP
jgi:GNAT superfamily N-acetyltransferase